MTIGAAAWNLSDVYARYSFGVDSRQAAVIRSCFTTDASLGVAGQAPTVGCQAITERLLHVADPDVVHHAFNVVRLQAGGGTLAARADFTMAKHGVVIATGHYNDFLRMDPDQGWVFSRRTVTYTWRTSMA